MVGGLTITRKPHSVNKQPPPLVYPSLMLQESTTSLPPPHIGYYMCA